MLQPKKILVPTDFSDSARKALLYAVEFAKTYGSQVLLCHVIEPPAYPMAMVAGTLQAAPEERELRGQIQKELDAAVSRVAGNDVAIEPRLLEGTPYVEITTMAEDEEVDLIVLPTHGRTGLAHMFLGSTAERVVRKAPCPVLVVREQSRDFIT